MPNIILVDDKEERRSVSRQLLDAGHRVVEGADGGHVIQMVNGNLRFIKFDVIIMNSQVPQIHGVDAVTYFRITYPDFPLIAILNSPDIALATDYLGMGVKDILVKPIEKSSLLKAVNKVAEQVVSK